MISISPQKVNSHGAVGVYRVLIMKIHDVTINDYVYVLDKSVHVCAYTRRRYDRLEYVCSHYRSLPNK